MFVAFYDNASCLHFSAQRANDAHQWQSGQGRCNPHLARDGQINTAQHAGHADNEAQCLPQGVAFEHGSRLVIGKLKLFLLGCDIGCGRRVFLRVPMLGLEFSQFQKPVCRAGQKIVVLFQNRRMRNRAFKRLADASNFEGTPVWAR